MNYTQATQPYSLETQYYNQIDSLNAYVSSTGKTPPSPPSYGGGGGGGYEGSGIVPDYIKDMPSLLCILTLGMFGRKKKPSGK